MTSPPKKLEEIQSLIQESDAHLLYFSTPSCNVCKVLLPKVKALIEEKYPKIGLTYLSQDDLPEVFSQFSVFTVPTLIFFFAGKEAMRRSRHVSIDELSGELTRPYHLLFK